MICRRYFSFEYFFLWFYALKKYCYNRLQIIFFFFFNEGIFQVESTSSISCIFLFFILIEWHIFFLSYEMSMKNNRLTYITNITYIASQRKCHRSGSCTSVAHTSCCLFEPYEIHNGTQWFSIVSLSILSNYY